MSDSLLDRMGHAAEALTNCIAEFDGDAAACVDHYEQLGIILQEWRQSSCTHEYGRTKLGDADFCAECGKRFTDAPIPSYASIRLIGDPNQPADTAMIFTEHEAAYIRNLGEAE